MKDQKSISNSPWYSEEAGFFDQEYLNEYGLISKSTTRFEVDFIEKHLSLNPPAKILDLPCGHGRHSVELAIRGYTVTGQDLNSIFLNAAQMLASGNNVNIELIKSDMRVIPFENEFDAVVNLFSSFGYLENDHEDQQVIFEISKALKPNGIFILDIRNRDRIIRQYRDKTWDESSNGTVILTSCSFDIKTGRNTEFYKRIRPNGDIHTYAISVRLYTVPELVTILNKAEFRIEGIFGGFDSQPLSFDSKRCIIKAKKSD